MPELSRFSPAKINLTLRVGGIRADGYHEIDSLVARIGLADTVHAARRADGRFQLVCDDVSIPSDERNLALRAARRLAEVTHASSGVDLRIEKRIPAGGGLGGGSSNAATTLLLLNELWQTRLNRAQLSVIGATIGSDVPCFLHGPVAQMSGRGELVRDLPFALRGWVALILPAIHSSTPTVYAAWDTLGQIEPHPSPQRLLAGVTSLSQLDERLFNDLETAAFQVSPELCALAEASRVLSAAPVHMTGSGAGLFRLFDDEGAARLFAAEIGKALRVRTEVVVFPAQ